MLIRWLPVVSAGALALLATGALQAQDGTTTQAERRATFAAGVDFVLVDVIVSDDDGPVADLAASDFEIVEDGAVQTIEEFRLIQVESAAVGAREPALAIRSAEDERREAGRDDVRVIVFFLDDYHTRFGNALNARRALVDFVRMSVSPNDLLAVMGPLTPLEAVRLTRDHDAVIREIEAFEGRRFRYDPRNGYEESYAFYPSAVIESIRNQVVISALRGLATHLGAVREGRKAVVYVSEGMAATVPAGIRNDRTAVGSGAVGARDAGRTSFSQQVFQQADLLDRLADVFNDANRNNTAIYTVDPRGLDSGGTFFDQRVSPGEAQAYLNDARSVLRLVAERTDGRAIVNRNDSAEGLRQVLDDASTYYLIGFTSTAEADGEFHPIDVRVNRPGVSVRARPGYWAATEDDLRRAATPAPEIPAAVEAALASIAAPMRAARYVRLWLGTERGGSGRTRVSLVWEPLPPPAGVVREPAEALSVVVISGDGDLLYRGRTPALGVVGGGPYRVVFDADPGPIELDVSVESGGGRLVDSEFREFDVPDLSAGHVAISAPRVYSALNARELRVLADNADAVPRPGREFRRNERLLIRFDTYGVGGESPVAEASLLNRSGARMSPLAIAPAGSGGTFQIELGLGSMPPGEYLVEISVIGAEAPVLVPLRISS
jgi:VWFA-related protein